MENTPIFEIEKIQASNLTELQGFKDKQLQIVKENPFIEITDTKTYDEAKKRRTALVKARTDIEKQDKVLASKIKAFREMVAGASAELIAITKPHEDKQQEEVKRYEREKEAERQEKIRLEEERKNKIKQAISDIFNRENKKLNELTFEGISSLKEDWEQNLFKTDTDPFQEFAEDFNEKVSILKQKLSEKETSLIEQENQRKENERLKEERERLEAEKRELQRQLKEDADRIAKEQAEKQAELDAEKEKLEAEKKAFEEAKQKQREKEEADARAKQEAERKAQEEKDRIAREKAEAERLEALKPDKEKAVEFINLLDFAVEIPSMDNEEITHLLKEFISEIHSTKETFLEKIKTLK